MFNFNSIFIFIISCILLAYPTPDNKSNIYPQKKDSFFYNQIRKIEMGILSAYVIPSYSGSEKITRKENSVNLHGGDFQFLIYRFTNIFDSKKKMDMSLYFNVHYGTLDFSVNSKAGRHNFLGDEYYYQTGLKQSLLPVSISDTKTEKQGSELDPYIKVGLSIKVNTHGEITYSTGPRPFEIASLNQLYGLVFGFGADFRFKWVTIASEFCTIINFSDYQSERKFTFSDLRYEFKNIHDRTTIKDITLDTIHLNLFQILISVRYRFEHF